MCSSTIVETAARSSATLAATTPRPCRIHRNLYACATSVTCSWSVVTRVHASANRFCPSYARRGRFTQGREQTMGKQWKKGSIPHIYSLSLSLSLTYIHTCKHMFLLSSKIASFVDAVHFQFGARGCWFEKVSNLHRLESNPFHRNIIERRSVKDSGNIVTRGRGRPPFCLEAFRWKKCLHFIFWRGNFDWYAWLARRFFRDYSVCIGRRARGDWDETKCFGKVCRIEKIIIIIIIALRLEFL